MSTAHLTLDQLDLNLFRVFDVVYRERNLRRAAVALSVTQSAVSHALARMRGQLGDPLFTRQGRGVAPTALAVELAPAIRDALGGLQRALLRHHDFDPARDLGALTVAMPGELEPVLLPPLVAHVHAEAPQLRLTIAQLERSRLRADLIAGRVDLAIDVAQPTDPDILHEPFLDEDFCVVASSRRRRLDRASYLAARHVAVSSRRTGPTLEDAQLGDVVQRAIAVRCLRYETACLLVASSDLLLTMPRRQAELRRRGLALRIFPPPVRMPRAQIHVYWPRATDDSAASRWLRQALRSVFAAARRRTRARR